MSTTLIENEDFSLVYSTDTQVFHYFIFRKRGIRADNVIDATGLVWRCTVFVRKSCLQFFNEDEVEDAVVKIINMKLFGHSALKK